MAHRLTTALLWSAVFGCLLLLSAAPAAAQKYKEAPMLAEHVKAGKLPPVDQRLPSIPYVDAVEERIGVYGGTWRRALRGGGDQHNFVRTIGYHNLVRWSRDWKEVEPHIAHKVESNSTATEFTFHLRPGMKWSDGARFNADDVLFWYEDILMDKRVTNAPDPMWTSGGEPVKVTKIDDVTVKFTFSKPYGLFLETLAYGFGAPPNMHPKHYLSKFHIRYNPNADADAKAAGKEGWVALLKSKFDNPWTPGYWQNPELPTLHPWMLTNAYGQATQVVAVRNPYYFKVDKEGNQLPYIDRITYDQTEDEQVIVLKALNGEIDYQLRHLNSPVHKAVLFDNQEKGGYRFFDVADSASNTASIGINFTIEDPVKRQVFRNHDFRAGISTAINRQEIIDLILVGQGEAWQVAPRRASPYYNEQLAKQYTDYSPDKANAMLDKVLPKKDAEGYRLGPDGKRFSFTVIAPPLFQYPDIMQLVEGYWKDVGVDGRLKVVDRSFMISAGRANNYDMIMWNTPGGLADAITDPRGYFPYNETVVYVAPLWARWYRDNSQGEEPPPEVRRIMDLYTELNGYADPAKRNAAFKQVIQWSADYFFMIGIYKPAPGFGIVNKRMHNIVDPLPMAGPLWHPSPNTAQFFFEGGHH